VSATKVKSRRGLSPLEKLVGSLQKNFVSLGRGDAKDSSKDAMEARDDEVLVTLARSGEKDAFRVLVERYENRLFSCALDVLKNSEDARDIVQEGFVKAYLSLPRFRGQSSFYTWVYRIVLNLSIDYRRKVARRGGDASELDEKTPIETTSPDVAAPLESVFRKEKAQKIQEALSSISPEHRRVIVLREVDGLSYDEIAQVLGISLGTVMSRLHYARKKLQVSLEEFAPSTRQSDGYREGGARG
jgi:RNA polymerase sigma-70 factor, ECF subfamily